MLILPYGWGPLDSGHGQDFNNNNKIMYIQFPFKNLANLFCATWMVPSNFCVGSSFFVLTPPRSWMPYLIFDLYRLSATFLSLPLLMKLFSLLMRYNLELRDAINLSMWVHHFWSSSSITPRSLVKVQHSNGYSWLCFAKLLNAKAIAHKNVKFNYNCVTSAATAAANKNCNFLWLVHASSFTRLRMQKNNK